ncbi:MAG: histidine kinase [Clostridia bacterium]|nr:histidine kinase [Clostridia bacterium]
MNEVIRLRNVECRDCYKCIRNCPVKAIRYSDGRAEIIHSECILCGECVVTCPQRGDFVASPVQTIREVMASGRRVVASVAPSFISDFPVGTIDGMRKTLRQLGFFDADETAIAGEIVSREYERIMRENEMDLLISSCCPSVVLLIQRYYPDVLPFLAPVKSPMELHCEMIKQKYPDAYTVFIGPCYAKKGEAEWSESVDVAITFYELREWMRAEGVLPMHVANPERPGMGMRSRRYPRQDGLVKSMTPVEGWNRVAIDGVQDCIAALSEIRHGGVEKTFLEMTACEGSCVNGPAIRKNRYENRIRGTVAVNEYAGNNDFGVTTDLPLRMYHNPEPVRRVMISEEEIQTVLHKLGKDVTPLNCGCCGYASCRKMAVAICRDMAQYDMCLPYLREQAESHSREIIDSTLEAADQVIDRQMRVVQDIASLLGETTAQTKLVLTKLKEAVQNDD